MCIKAFKTILYNVRRNIGVSASLPLKNVAFLFGLVVSFGRGRLGSAVPALNNNQHEQLFHFQLTN